MHGEECFSRRAGQVKFLLYSVYFVGIRAARERERERDMVLLSSEPVYISIGDLKLGPVLNVEDPR